jgi:G3E family GTPase
MKLRNRVVDICERLSQLPVPIVLIQGLPAAGQEILKTQMRSQMSGTAIEIIDSFPDLGNESSCTQCSLTNHFLNEIQNAIGKLKTFQNESKLLCIDIPPELDVSRLTTSIAEEFGAEKVCFVQAIITCIDPDRFIWDYLKDRSHEDRFNELGLPKHRISKTALSRPVLEDLINHVECADFFFVNGSLTESLAALLKNLQPQARFIYEGETLKRSLFSASPIFIENQTYRSAGWQKALFSKDQSPYCFRARRPFHPVRLNALIDEWPETIIRSCGTVWLASHNDLSLSVSQVGPDGFFFSPEGYWIGTLPPLEQQIAIQNDPALREQEKNWHPKYADRMTEIAFVSDEPLSEAWTSKLESCLLSDLEMRMNWERFPNPFPTFNEEESEINEGVNDSVTSKARRPSLSLIPTSEN